MAMKKLQSLLLILTMAMFIACGDDDEDEAAGDVTLRNGDVLTGEFVGARTVTVEEDATITLKGLVRFKEGSKLVIKPGVTVKGDPAVLSYLVIERGAQIFAEGTKEKPITFTSGRPEGARRPQDWGGIVINGYAKVNEGTEVAGEGDSGMYGGSNDDDNSGVLRYVRVYFAGYPFSATNELNGIALQGVGSGTRVEYVQIHNGADDGIEMFGGAVNLKYIVSTANGDDQIDATFGWRGKVQFAIAATINVTGADSAMEYDNNETNFNAEPRTKATHYNMTVLALRGYRGARMRRGTDAYFYNSYFAFHNDLSNVSLTNRLIFAEDSASQVTFDYCIFENFQSNTDGYTTSNGGTINAGSNITKTASPGTPLIDLGNFTLTNLQSKGAAAFVPQSGATNGNVTGTTPPNDGFFDTSATFIGAVKDAASNWLAGWTAFPAN